MIKKGMMAVCGLMLAMSVSAQNAYDAERVLRNAMSAVELELISGVFLPIASVIYVLQKQLLLQ